MGTITITTPKEIRIQYVLNTEETEKLIQKLQEIKVKPLTPAPDNLMGLFSDDVDLMDQIMEWTMKARENDTLRTLTWL